MLLAICIRLYTRSSTILKYMLLAMGSAACLLTVCFCESVIAQPPLQQPPAHGRILIINSYHPGYPWSDDETEGIRQGLLESFSDDLMIEYLDCKHFPDNALSDAIRQAVSLKYGRTRLALIITADNPALNFVLRYRSGLFPGVPVVFCGINGYKPAMLAGQENITGAVETLDIGGTVQAMLGIHPEARMLFLVHDYTVTGFASRDEAQEQLSEAAKSVQIRYSENVGIQELLDQVKVLPHNALILILSYSRDRDGKVFNHQEVAALFSDSAPVPVYGVHELRLGSGIVGGSLLSGKLHGATAARIAAQVLSGRSAENIPVDARPSAQYMFDFKQLVRFGIPPELLPAHSSIINKPPSFFMRYRVYVLAAAGTVPVLTVVVLTLLLNIMQRRKAERSLQQSEQRFRAIAHYTADWEVWVGTDGRLVWVNPAVEKHTGYSAEECLAMPDYPFPLIHPDDRETVRRFRADAIGGSSAAGIEFRVVRKDGALRWMSTSYNPIFDSGGKSLGFRASIHDISSRKIVEEALRQATQQWQATFNATNDAIALLNTEHKILQCNKAMAELFGKPIDALLNRFCWEIVHETAQPIAECPVMRMQKSLHREEMELRKGDQWLHVTVDPFLDQNRKLSGAVHIIRDITERKQAEEQQLTLERQLLYAQKLESLGVLAGGIAHDFNNILAAMLGYVELALDDLPFGSAIRDDIMEIEKAIHRATDLARQMLAYTGRGKGDIHLIGLNSLVQEMSHLLSASISKKVTLRYNLADSLPAIEGDITQIRQVVVNLITNAAEAIGEGSGTITIATGVLQCDRDYLDGCAPVYRSAADEHPVEGRYVYLEVTDTGCGMDRHTQERIFDPFFTTKFIGRGLGMAVVLGIVRGHRAAIRIHSEVGRGTTFRILFPSGTTAAAQIAEDKPAPALQEWSGSGLVLLVDDEESVRYTGRVALRKLGFDVITASDGNECLIVFRNNADRIVCVLLDMTMPGMNGDEVLRKIRNIRADIPVILSSGFTEQEAALKLVREGAALFLSKPYKRHELAAKLQEVLDKN